MSPPAKNDILERISAHVRAETETRRKERPPESLKDTPLYHRERRGFRRVLSRPGRHVIAEVKRTSPSQGVIREDFDPLAIASRYEASGATALSVLTEERFFNGSLAYLSGIAATVSLPLLRKDFTLDPYHLVEARGFGADAVLLIAAILEEREMAALQAEARSLSLDVLVEVHSQTELETALNIGASMIGINNRNLHTFEVDLGVAEALLPGIPAEVLAVCESGIKDVEHVERLEAAGGKVFLVGETLMRSPDPGVKLAELLGADGGAERDGQG